MNKPWISCHYLLNPDEENGHLSVFRNLDIRAGLQLQLEQETILVGDCNLEEGICDCCDIGGNYIENQKVIGYRYLLDEIDGE